MSPSVVRHRKQLDHPGCGLDRKRTVEAFSAGDDGLIQAKKSERFRTKAAAEREAANLKSPSSNQSLHNSRFRSNRTIRTVSQPGWRAENRSPEDGWKIQKTREA